jgi:hypothetical protein
MASTMPTALWPRILRRFVVPHHLADDRVAHLRGFRAHDDAVFTERLHGDGFD